jgi:hypothetical protein
MKVSRKIAMVVNHVKMDDEDTLDVAFWLAQTPSSRLAEVFRLRKNYFTWLDGSFPEKMDIVVHQRKM